MLPYSAFLVLSGILIAIAERVWPRVPGQPLLRRGFFLDLVYLFFNAEIVGALVSIWLTSQIPPARILPWRDSLGLAWLLSAPVWLQLILLLFVKDFFQWLVHNLMHRIPALWHFHRIHHSTEQMDWLSNWRFHWFEIVAYQLVLYLPATLVGVSPEAAYGCAILSTLIGHLAHANLRLSLGFLEYIFNSPSLHAWHHVHPDHGPTHRNYAISLSVWDWLFGTAYLPGHMPKRLGLKESEASHLPV